MSDHHAIEIVELNHAAVQTDTAGCDARMTPGDQNDAVTLCLNQVNRLLRKAPEELRAETSRHTIFRIPPPLRGVNPKAVEPEVVSIGPYHRGRPQVLAFEKLKPLFLQSFLRRMDSDSDLDLNSDSDSKLMRLARIVAHQESSVRSSSVRTLYSEHVDMTRAEFVQMMLLDGCFVVELLRTFRGDDATPDDPILSRPQIIPPLIRDLLKLENQIPYSLLQSLFDASGSQNLTGAEDSLAILALKLFDQAYPRSIDRLKSCLKPGYEHLLDLFHSTLKPTSPPKKADSFLDISSRKPVPRKPFVPFEDFVATVLKSPVLEIPDIAINDFMTTVLINCVSLEQCRAYGSKYMTDYVCFMHCLIKQPKDVSLLRSDGIIAPFSHDDQYVADLFDKLGNSISFNVNGCFLSELFGELDKYYRSNGACVSGSFYEAERGTDHFVAVNVRFGALDCFLWVGCDRWLDQGDQWGFSSSVVGSVWEQLSLFVL
ncbi:hypothetical protein NL676_034099 [Syzygium grande]|nr:hypothetical protein NL676_034099 [Syzygium grande]